MAQLNRREGHAVDSQQQYGSAHQDDNSFIDENNGIFVDENGKVHIRAQILGERVNPIIRRRKKKNGKEGKFMTFMPNGKKEEKTEEKPKREIQTLENRKE